MRSSTRLMILAGCVLTTAFSPTGARGGIVGSAHDFSIFGWAQNQICLPCHTPHNADTTVEAPLWNHELTSATFELYSSQWLDEQPEQPGANSMLCLSCHDGTVALDSFGGAAGMTLIAGDALIGTDLGDDHPIGIDWSHQNTDLVCFNCHDPYAPPGDNFISALPFYGGKIECGTCHTPHDEKGNPYLLRLPILGSQVCLHCHNP